MKRETILAAELDQRLDARGKDPGTLCEFGPPVISFLKALTNHLPWWSPWARPVAKAAIVLLEKLLEERCPRGEEPA